MTPRVCPHCSATLPPVGDAYCSDCGSRIDEPPADRHESSQAEGGGSGFDLPTQLIVAGVLALVIAVFAAVIRRSWSEALYTGGGGIVLFITGLFLRSRPSRPSR